MFLAMNGIDFLHKCQILEDSLLGIAESSNCCLGQFKYLVSRTLFHQVEEPVISLQAIFPLKARFRILEDLIPRPPLSWV